MAIADELKERYEKIAVKTVIRYFADEKIKMSILDFNIGKRSGKNYDTHIYHWNFGDENAYKISIHIYVRGRWEKDLKDKKDAFLKYYNAVVGKDYVEFTFSRKELDLLLISTSSVESDTEKEKIEKVKKKIEKLLALADLNRNNSEHEAISASLKAQKLLAEYHLTIAEVRGEEAPHEAECEEVWAENGKGNSKFNWRWELADAVARGYCCKNFCRGSGRTDGTVVFFGYREDIVLARRIFVYLYNVGNKLGNEYARKADYWEENPYASFTMGFVRGVTEQLQKQCTALALIVQPEVEDAYSNIEFSSHLQSARSKSLSAEAYEEGRVEGKRAFNAQYIES